MEDDFELSAFEYVELIEKYKNKIDSLTEEEFDDVISEHNENEGD